jgi:glycosyltransferase involved in cell wall biosynthesis
LAPCFVPLPQRFAGWLSLISTRGHFPNMLTVADLSPYWCWPPTGGGPLRVFNMNREVARQVRVLQFSARPTFGHRQAGSTEWHSSHTCQIVDRYQEYEYFHPLVVGTGYLLYRLGLHSDIYLSSLLKWLSPRELSEVVARASIVQVEHPWLFRLALQLADGKPIVYVAHNVEARLWEAQAENQGPFLRKLVLRPRTLEREAVRRADFVVAMSSSDVDFLVNEYGADPAKICVIPNGVDLRARRPSTPEEKRGARLRLGLDDRPVAFFVGSDHYPNKEALEHIQRWQAQLGPERDVQFVVVGGVGHGVTSTQYMRVEGFVESVADYLAAADIALNPLTSGSGTSLKAVEYLACGLPTITTAMGMRGLELVSGHDVLQGKIGDFPDMMIRLLTDQELRLQLSYNGRKAVEQNYGWETLAERMLAIYERISQCESVS